MRAIQAPPSHLARWTAAQQAHYAARQAAADAERAGRLIARALPEATGDSAAALSTARAACRCTLRAMAARGAGQAQRALAAEAQADQALAWLEAGSLTELA